MPSHTMHFLSRDFTRENPPFLSVHKISLKGTSKQPTLETLNNHAPTSCEGDRWKDLHSQFGRRGPSGKLYSKPLQLSYIIITNIIYTATESE